MAVEITCILRFERYPPPDFADLLEQEFECIVIEYTEEEEI